MYVTDANGKIVQFQYHKEDSDEELMYQSKSKLQIKQQPSPGKNFSPMRPSVQD